MPLQERFLMAHKMMKTSDIADEATAHPVTLFAIQQERNLDLLGPEFIALFESTWKRIEEAVHDGDVLHVVYQGSAAGRIMYDLLKIIPLPHGFFVPVEEDFVGALTSKYFPEIF